MKKITLLAILFCGSAFGQIINTAPYILTVDELKAWTQNGPTASTDLISTMPLGTRFTNQSTQFNPALTNDMQIAYLPDGMNNFGNYFGEQNVFNLYNFTHWAYIDKLVWFGGTSSQSIQIPSSPWANAAHKNGVKIFGNVFFAPTAFGGSTATLQNFLEQDVDGHFIAVPKMIAIMQYYGFDGWFINQETATNSTVAALMHDFVRDLTTAAEALGKEVMWYDAMRLSGAVGWQNRLNMNNSPFVQDDQDADGTFETRVSSSIFINFFWGNTFPPMSRARALTISRSQYEVFTGADIWPNRNQGDFEVSGNTFMGNLHENATTPYTSLGLFAPNCIFNNSTYTSFNNDPDDYESFYAAENRMFAGTDSNPAIVDATGWKGFCNWVPETSVITTLPFETNFCTGHGYNRYTNGLLTTFGSWHNMNDQDILPTWQWAFSPNSTLTAQWDFGMPYNFGNSLRISGNLPQPTPVDLWLYKSKLSVTANTQIELTYRRSFIASDFKLIVVFADEPTQSYEFQAPASGSSAWLTTSFPFTAYAGREIAKIGLRFVPNDTQATFDVHFGKLGIYDTTLGIASQKISPDFITVSYPENNRVVFTVNWPNSSKLNYAVYDLQGNEIKTDSIALIKTTNYNFDTNGMASGTYIIKFTDQDNTTVTKKILVK